MEDRDRYLDTDGEPLLFSADIERLTGWRTETVRHYSTAGNRARREGTADSKSMPAAVKRVRRTMVKGNGKPLVVWASLWRRDQILAWLAAKEVQLAEE